MKLNKKQTEKLNKLIDSVKNLHKAYEIDDTENNGNGYFADDTEGILAEMEDFIYELGKIDKKVFSFDFIEKE